jgi:hypothetical protein
LVFAGTGERLVALREDSGCLSSAVRALDPARDCALRASQPTLRYLERTKVAEYWAIVGSDQTGEPKVNADGSARDWQWYWLRQLAGEYGVPAVGFVFERERLWLPDFSKRLPRMPAEPANLGYKDTSVG